ncbi:MAG: iron-sulfur cluster assembly protein [Planctomycetota bacterium]
MPLHEDHVREAIKKVIDPELFVNIVDLGLIYVVDVVTKEGDPETYDINIEMTMTSPMCPAGPQLVAETKKYAGELENVDSVEVKVVMDPPWTQDMMTDDARDQLGIF